MKTRKTHSVFLFLLVVSMVSCSTMGSESEVAIRTRLTTAVDNASSEIIKNLPNGIRLAVLGGTSSGNDQEIVIYYLKNHAGFSDFQVREYIRSRGQLEISQMATQLRTQGISYESSYADYAVEDLEYNIVQAGSGFRLIDRQQIEKIRSEQQFQMSGEVDDNSAVDLGKMTGANAVIVISVSYADKSGRLTLKVLDVQTAEIIAMARQVF